jgi:hypothetical protein
MAKNGSEIDPEAMTGDELLVIALAGGTSVKAAAEIADMSERTAYRRRAEAAFRRRLTRARAEMRDRAIGHLSAAAADAAITLRKVLGKEDSPALQVRAAEAILDRLGLDSGQSPKCRRRDAGDDAGGTAENPQEQSPVLVANSSVRLQEE